MSAEIRRIVEEGELAQVLARPGAVWLFKHSLTCPTSARAWFEFQAFVEGGGDGSAYHLIEVQVARPVSNTIAERTGIRHESPQAILLVDGQPVWHASHHHITRASLGQASLGQVRRA